MCGDEVYGDGITSGQAYTSCEEYGHLFINDNGDRCPNGEAGTCRDCGDTIEADES